MVSTHNQFVMGHRRFVYNPHAPIITLPAGATENDHLALLGLLNSSTACFWMKQVMTGKHKGDGGEAHADPAYQRFEFTGTQMQNLPIPQLKPLAMSRQLEDLARQYALHVPEATAHVTTPSSCSLATARIQATSIRSQLIAMQEELDWHCYGLYERLVPDDLYYTGDDSSWSCSGSAGRSRSSWARQMAASEP